MKKPLKWTVFARPVFENGISLVGIMMIENRVPQLVGKILLREPEL
jgi:hypothetical protein